MTETCRGAGCGAAFHWAYTVPNGRRIPVDVEPSDDGNVLYTGNIADDGVPYVRVLSATAVEVVRHAGDTLDGAPPPARYKPHFATCPDADRFRKTR